MKEQLEAKAINEVKKAVSMTFQVLVDLHTKVKNPKKKLKFYLITHSQPLACTIQMLLFLFYCIILVDHSPFYIVFTI